MSQNPKRQNLGTPLEEAFRTIHGVERGAPGRCDRCSCHAPIFQRNKHCVICDHPVANHSEIQLGSISQTPLDNRISESNSVKILWFLTSYSTISNKYLI